MMTWLMNLIITKLMLPLSIFMAISGKMVVFRKFWNPKTFHIPVLPFIAFNSFSQKRLDYDEHSRFSKDSNMAISYGERLKGKMPCMGKSHYKTEHIDVYRNRRNKSLLYLCGGRGYCYSNAWVGRFGRKLQAGFRLFIETL